MSNPKKGRKISIIAIKFWVIVFLLNVSLLSLLGIFVSRVIRDNLIKEMKLKSEIFAREIRDTFSPEIDIFRIHFKVAESKKDKSILYSIVQMLDGKVVSHSEGEKFVGEIDDSEISKTAIKSDITLFQEYFDKGTRIYEISSPIFIGEKKVAITRIGFSDKTINVAMKGLIKNIISIGVIISVVSFFITFLIVSFIIKPITTLSDIALEICSGNFEVVIPKFSKDEIGHLADTFRDLVNGLKKRDFIKETFGKYLDPKIVDKLIEGGVRLGGERKKVTVLFADMRNFTDFSEKTSPEIVLKTLNFHFSEIVKIITSHHGMIDKFMGDSVLGVFGIPDASPEDALNALLSGIEIVNNMNKKGNSSFGVSIHTGDVVSGNIGSERRMEFTVIGDTINITCRLQEYNRKLSQDLILTQHTMSEILNLTGNYRFIDLGEVQVRGRKELIKIYTIPT